MTIGEIFLLICGSIGIICGIAANIMFARMHFENRKILRYYEEKEKQSEG